MVFFCVSEVEKALEMDDEKRIDKKQKTKKHKKNHNKEEKKDKATLTRDEKNEKLDARAGTLKRLGLNRIGKKPDIPPPDPPKPTPNDFVVPIDTQSASPRKIPLQATMSQPQPMANVIQSLGNRPHLRSVGTSRSVDNSLETSLPPEHQQPGRPAKPPSKSPARRTQSFDSTLDGDKALDSTPLPRPRHRPPLPPPPDFVQAVQSPRHVSTSSTSHSSSEAGTHDSSGEEHKPRPIPRSRPRDGTLSRDETGIPKTNGMRQQQPAPMWTSPRRDESRQPEPHALSSKPNRPLPRAPKTEQEPSQGEAHIGNSPAVKATPPGWPATIGRKATPIASKSTQPVAKPAPAPKPRVPNKPGFPKKPSSVLGDWKSDTTLSPKVREICELSEKGHQKVQEITSLSYSRPPDSESYIMEVLMAFKDIYHQVMDCSSGLTSSLSPQARFSVRRSINTLETRFGEMDSLSNSVGLNPSSSDVEKIGKLASGVLNTMDELCSSLRGPSK